MLADAGPLKLDLELRSGQAVMNLVGEVDIATVPLVRECVNALASSPAGAPVVIVDLTEVHFIDSTAWACSWRDWP
jgi:anti-anti-sigma factor